MRDGIIGIVIGLVVGVVVGTSFLAPQLASVAEVSDAIQAESSARPDEPSLPDRPADPPILAAAKPEALQWRMASAFSSSFPLIGELPVRLETELRRISNGDVALTHHEPDALVPTASILDAVGSGLVEAGYSTPSLWQEREPALALFAGHPFGPDAEEFLAWMYFGGGGALMADVYKRFGVHAVVCGAATAEGSGWFRHPPETVDDFRNLRISISGMPARVLRRLGATTMPLAIGDAFAALETDQIDAVEFAQPSVDLRVGLHRMVPHYYFPGWHQPVVAFDLLINAGKWDALSGMRKAQIESVCGDLVRQGLAEGDVAQFKALKNLVAQGAKVHRWPREFMDAFRAAWEQEASELAANDEAFGKVWTKLDEFRRDYAVWRDLSMY